MRSLSESRRVGFTLVELLVVIAIIGLLISLILVAAADGVRRAEERATQALITKLETALNDRLDALLNTQPPINQTHRLLAAINFQQNGNYVPVGSATNNSDDRRAQVIAQFDYLRAEIPDVFFLNASTSNGATAAASYPFNFAAAPYPQGSNTLPDSYVLPLGNNSPGLPFNASGQPAIPSPLSTTYPPQPITGMFGASFSAAGGIYKNLGYAPQGYDGIDNNQNGYIDEYAEGIVGLSAVAIQAIQTKIGNHQHKTARSEMLYALLVEGLSPLGSAFGPDDFTAREVQDTDGDGLPEFVDAWGEPLQFYRWPIYYGGFEPNGQVLGTSDSQRGYLNYFNASNTREQDPLDTNQLLVSPGWWSSAANPSTSLAVVTFTPPNGNSTTQSSPGAIAFMSYFHSIVDPYPGVGTGWDRAGSFNRRAYFSKFLILSGGPDRQPGVGQLNKNYGDLFLGGSNSTFPNSNLSMESNAQLLIYIENQAAVSDPVPSSTARVGSFYELPQPVGTSPSPTSIYLQGGTVTASNLNLQGENGVNSDDITNHNISGISTGVR